MTGILYIMSYCIICSLLAYGVLWIVYRRKIKKGTYTTKCLLHKAPPVIGVMNLLLGAAFLLLYVIEPEGFSNQNVIASPIIYVLFTIFCIYFYLVAVPLSMGIVGLSLVIYKKKEITEKRCFFTVCTNLMGTIFIVVLMCQIFA